MSIFRHILFPVDFSERCRAVAPAAIDLARRCGARLTLLHAVDLPPGAYADWYAFSAMVDVAAIKEHEGKLLNEFLPGQPDLVRVLADGAPVPAITRYAAEHGVDLIMLPTHGHTRFRSLLLGSVTSGVLHDAACPVWTAAHAEGLPRVQKYARVLCAVDLGESTGRVAAWAARFAEDMQAELHLAHALPAIADPAHSLDVAKFRDNLRAEAFTRYHELVSGAGAPQPCEMLLTLAGESVGETLARHAQGVQADVLIAGRGAIQGTFGRLRTHVNDIIRRAPCPVISV